MPLKYRSLPELRRDIDTCNLELLSLVSKRAKLAISALQFKDKVTDDVFDPERQLEMLATLVKANQGPFSDDTIVSIFRGIFQHILDLMSQERKTTLKVHRKQGDPDQIYEINGHKIGDQPIYIAGPCAIESEEQLDNVAKVLRQHGVIFLRGGAFKPRSSPYAFQGMGERGLKVLRDVAHRYGMVSVTEVMDPRSVEMVAIYADVLQVGTRNMYNYPLLRELGKIDKPVLLKRGFSATLDEFLFATLDEFLFAAEYIVAGGNYQVILCERGIRTFTKETRYTLDISSVPLLRKMTGCPVIVDVSHAAGRTDILEPLVAAAFAVGAKGVMLEVHPCPPVARSDADQQLTPEEFVKLKDNIHSYIMGNLPSD
ncbi:MAG: bifunctional 3-deoxy-7-phosphoheptulonate synthase/chorismate mutase [Deltaproteobacteria bacterium]|nr:bifunctional 3-deoxy-7-phosphoheptulonate synthase/chorismate mutase [Deltaproteobacteria bacterium]